MGQAKEIIIKPIKASVANRLVKRVHYSGKVVNNSQLHFGIFLNGVLEGAMQFGPSLAKKKMQGLVEGTGWNEFIELNRMALSDKLPRNSESRAIGVVIRILKRHYPQVRWIISFADGAQCGDGTIYRASGFVLTGIKESHDSYTLKGGESFTAITIKLHGYSGAITKYLSRKEFHNIVGVKFSNKKKIEELMKYIGASRNEGFQLRYLYFIDKTAKDRLTVPIIPFSKINDIGASMYKGVKSGGLVEGKQIPSVNGGSTPTSPLQNK